MENTKLGYQVWAMSINILTTGIKGVSSMKLHRDLGITQKKAWFLAYSGTSSVGSGFLVNLPLILQISSPTAQIGVVPIE